MVQSHLKAIWQVFFKPKHTTSIVLLDIYPREMETYGHTKNLYMNVYSSFIHNNPKLEATQTSFSG